jgi:hypothetical protein
VSQSSYGISKIINAPISYVYKWCTDFRAEDPMIIGAAYTRHIVDKSNKRAVWIQHYGAEKEGVRYVTLSPPDSWHMEGLNDESTRTVDYHLKSLGKKTELTISIKIKYKTIEPEPVSKLRENLSNDWEKYKAALEKDYLSR